MESSSEEAAVIGTSPMNQSKILCMKTNMPMFKDIIGNQNFLKIADSHNISRFIILCVFCYIICILVYVFIIGVSLVSIYHLQILPRNKNIDIIFF